MTTLVTAGAALSLTNVTWYNCRVVIGDDVGNSTLQRLRFYVDVAGDGFGNGATRRTRKVVANCGREITANDGGDQTVNFYYDSQWRIAETRNGSNQTLMAFQHGQRYVDEHVFYEVNGDPTLGNDTNPDNTPGGESSEAPADKRYFFLQDRNWNVVAISETGGGNDGRIAERYAYTPYGTATVIAGDSGSGTTGKTRMASSIGNALADQNRVSQGFAPRRVFSRGFGVF